MIKIDKFRCTGCSACMAACRFDAISMKPDEFGFMRPVVDVRRCKECGLCEHVCPLLQERRVRSAPRCFAAKTNNAQLLLESTSGAIFPELAKAVLEDGGIVYGCVLQDLNPIHVRAETWDEVARMRGSKYVQSDMRDSLRECQDDLVNGRRVLFSGTPCQIAGLKAFLGKEYDNLLTVALICHGVSSPKLFHAYLRDEETWRGGKVAHVLFRDKLHIRGKSSFVILWADPMMLPHVEDFYSGPYMRAFLSARSYRQSCFACHFRSGKSNADVIIGDFWGIEKVLPDFSANDGVSAVLVYTARGLHAINELDLRTVEVKYEDIAKCNYNLDQDSKKPRDFEKFSAQMLRGVSLSEYFNRLDHPIFPIRVLRFSRRCVTKVLRMMGVHQG